MLFVLCAPLAAAPAGLRLPKTFQQIAAPTNITGAVLWLDASQLGLTNDAPVSLWTDLSGAGNNATQSTAGLRPTLQTNGINGLPSVRFGTTNWLFNASMTNAQPLTLFAVARQTGGGAGFRTMLDGVASSPRLLLWYIVGSSKWGVFGGTATVSQSSTSSTNWAIVTAVADGSSSRFRINSATEGTGNAGTQGISGGFTLGDAFVRTGEFRFNGEIGELIVFSRVLSAVERTQVRGYLNNKWSIY